MHWQITNFPRCTHHVFLSHCAEDRDWLILPLFERLRRRRIIPWLDRHDYPYGRTSLQALRDGVLRCQHVVFFVTAGMLSQPRGWTVIESAWADLLQENMREIGGVWQTVALPLFFLSRTDARILRSAWHPWCDRAAFHDPAAGDALDWAEQQIGDFLLREFQCGFDNARCLAQDATLMSRLSRRGGFVERITSQFPGPVP